MEGAISNDSRSYLTGVNIGEGNLNSIGGGTYTATAEQPTIADYENIFGPAARDIVSACIAQW